MVLYDEETAKTNTENYQAEQKKKQKLGKN